MILNRSSASRSRQTTRTGKRPMNSGSKPYSTKSFVDVLKQFVVHHLDRLRPETDLSLTDAPRDLLFQFFKRAADDEKNVAGVDRLALGFALSLELKSCLQLRLEIVHAPNGHFGFFH